MAVVVDATEELAGVLDALGAVDANVLADAATVVALHRQLERLGALTTVVTAAFEARGSWEADGARTAGAWVAARCRLPVAVARRRVHLGRCLRSMPGVAGAWLAGNISEAHVGLLASVRTPQTAVCFERDESLLIEQARTLRYGVFATALAY